MWLEQGIVGLMAGGIVRDGRTLQDPGAKAVRREAAGVGD